MTEYSDDDVDMFWRWWWKEFNPQEEKRWSVRGCLRLKDRVDGGGFHLA